MYRRVGQVWLPESDYSKTRVRIFGTAILTITYRDYQIAESPDPTIASDSTLGPRKRTGRALTRGSQNSEQIRIHPLELLPLTPAASTLPER